MKNPIISLLVMLILAPFVIAENGGQDVKVEDYVTEGKLNYEKAMGLDPEHLTTLLDNINKMEGERPDKDFSKFGDSISGIKWDSLSDATVQDAFQDIFGSENSVETGEFKKSLSFKQGKIFNGDNVLNAEDIKTKGVKVKLIENGFCIAFEGAEECNSFVAVGEKGIVVNENHFSVDGKTFSGDFKKAEFLDKGVDIDGTVFSGFNDLDISHILSPVERKEIFLNGKKILLLKKVDSIELSKHEGEKKSEKLVISYKDKEGNPDKMEIDGMHLVKQYDRDKGKGPDITINHLPEHDWTTFF